MIKNKAFKFRIYPNADQAVLLAKTFGSVRLVFNYYLGEKIRVYESSKETLAYSKCSKNLTLLKKEKDFLTEIDSIALQQSLRHLDTAYKNFFRDKKVGFPKFKSKKYHHFSYSTVCVNNNIRLDGGFIKLPKIGQVKIKQHRAISASYTLKSATVSKTPTGKYFVSILFEYETEISPSTGIKSIGLDFSMPKLFVSSEGTVADYPRYFRLAQENLARQQRILSHRKPGGSNYAKQKRKVAIIHEKVADQRKDFLHKLSRQIANDYDIVCIEDLNMGAMAQCLNFGKSVSDNGWGMFTALLKYKLEDRGKELIKVDKWFASSKTCSVCGHVHKALKLSDRKWECAGCHTVHDRDSNASVNIKKKGLAAIAV